MNKEKEMEVVENLLEETFTEKYLNVYFNEIEQIYGIDIAIETAMEKESIKDSIGQYTRMPEDVNDLDINLAILKSIVLSDDANNIYTRYVKEKISNGETDELIQDMISNIHLRRTFVKTFVEGVLVPPKKKYERVEDKETAIGNLATLHYYKLEQEQRKPNSLQLAKKGAN